MLSSPGPLVLLVKLLELAACQLLMCGKLEPALYMSAQSLTHIRLFAAPWTVARQLPLSLGFPRQEYWNGLPFPSPECTVCTDTKIYTQMSDLLPTVHFCPV